MIGVTVSISAIWRSGHKRFHKPEAMKRYNLLPSWTSARNGSKPQWHLPFWTDLPSCQCHMPMASTRVRKARQREAKKLDP